MSQLLDVISDPDALTRFLEGQEAGQDLDVSAMYESISPEPDSNTNLGAIHGLQAPGLMHVINQDHLPLSANQSQNLLHQMVDNQLVSQMAPPAAPSPQTTMPASPAAQIGRSPHPSPAPSPSLRPGSANQIMNLQNVQLTDQILRQMTQSSVIIQPPAKCATQAPAQVVLQQSHTVPQTTKMGPVLQPNSLQSTSHVVQAGNIQIRSPATASPLGQLIQPQQLPSGVQQLVVGSSAQVIQQPSKQQIAHAAPTNKSVQGLVQPLTAGGAVLSAQGGTIVQNAGVLNINVNSLQAQPAVHIAGQTGINLAQGSSGANQVNLQGTIVQTSQGNKLVIQGQPTVGLGQPLNLLVPNNYMGIQQVLLRPPVVQHIPPAPISQPVSLQAAVNVPQAAVASNIGQVNLGVRLPLPNSNPVSTNLPQTVNSITSVTTTAPVPVVNIQGTALATSQPINMVNVGGAPIVIQHAPGGNQNVILQVPSSCVQGQPGQVTVRQTQVGQMSIPGQVTVRPASVTNKVASPLNVTAPKTVTMNTIPPVSGSVLNSSQLNIAHSQQSTLQANSSNPTTYEQTIKVLNSQIQMLKGLPASKPQTKANSANISTSFGTHSLESKKSTIHYMPNTESPSVEVDVTMSQVESPPVSASEYPASNVSPLPVLDILQSACLNAAIPGSDFFAESQLNLDEPTQQISKVDNVKKPIPVSQLQLTNGCGGFSVASSNTTVSSSGMRHSHGSNNYNKAKLEMINKLLNPTNLSVKDTSGAPSDITCVDLTGSDEITETLPRSSSSSVVNVQTIPSQHSLNSAQLITSLASVVAISTGTTAVTDMPSALRHLNQSLANSSQVHSTATVTTMSRPPPNVEICSTGIVQGSNLAKATTCQTETMAIQEGQISSTDSIISELFPATLGVKDIYDDLKHMNPPKTEPNIGDLFGSNIAVNQLVQSISKQTPKIDVVDMQKSGVNQSSSSKVDVHQLISNQAKLILGNSSSKSGITQSVSITNVTPSTRHSVQSGTVTNILQSQPIANISHLPQPEEFPHQALSPATMVSSLPVTISSQILVPAVVSTSNVVGTSASATLTHSRNLSVTNNFGVALVSGVNSGLNITTNTGASGNSSTTSMPGLLLPKSQPIHLSLEHQQLLYKIQQQLRKLMAITDRNPQQEKVMQGLMNARQKILTQGRVAAIIQQEQRKQMPVQGMQMQTKQPVAAADANEINALTVTASSEVSSNSLVPMTNCNKTVVSSTIKAINAPTISANTVRPTMSTSVATTSTPFTVSQTRLPLPVLNQQKPKSAQSAPDLVKQLQQLLALPSDKRQSFLRSNPRLLHELQRLQLQKQQKQVAPPTTPLQVQPQPKPGGLLQSLTSPISRTMPRMISKKEVFAQRMLKDQKAAIAPDTKTPFKSLDDACIRLLRYHVYQEREPTEEEKNADEELYELKCEELLSKYKQMLNKYQHLLIQESMKKSPIAEVVMMERVFIQQEKERLKEEKLLAKNHPESLKPCPAPEKKSELPGGSPEIIDHHNLNSSRSKTYASVENNVKNFEENIQSEKTSVYDVHRRGSLKLVIKSSPKHTPNFSETDSGASIHDIQEEKNCSDKECKPIHFKERFKRKAWNTHGDHDRTSNDEIPSKYSKSKIDVIDISDVNTASSSVVVKTEIVENALEQTLPFTSYSQEPNIKEEREVKEEEELYDFEKSDMDYALEDYAQNIENPFHSNTSDSLSESSKMENSSHVDAEQFIDDFLNSQSELHCSSLNMDVAKSESLLSSRLDRCPATGTPSSNNDSVSYGNFSPITPEEKTQCLNSKPSVQSKRDPAEMQSAINSILDVDMGCDQLETASIPDTSVEEVFVNSSQEVGDEDLDAAINSIL